MNALNALLQGDRGAHASAQGLVDEYKECKRRATFVVTTFRNLKVFQNSEDVTADSELVRDSVLLEEDKDSECDYDISEKKVVRTNSSSALAGPAQVLNSDDIRKQLGLKFCRDIDAPSDSADAALQAAKAEREKATESLVGLLWP